MYRLLAMKEVVKIIGLSRATIYELIKAGDFIPPIRLTDSRIAFSELMLERWIDSRPFVATKQGGLNGRS
jgi:prophage regulatory protein